jgi:hypothetical protein
LTPPKKKTGKNTKGPKYTRPKKATIKQQKQQTIQAWFLHACMHACNGWVDSPLLDAQLRQK